MSEPKARAGAAWMERVTAEITRGRHVIVHGNVRDLVRWEGGFLPFRAAITSLLGAFGYQLVGFYDVADGLTFAQPGGEAEFRRLSVVPDPAAQDSAARGQARDPAARAEPVAGNGRGAQALNRAAEALRSAPAPSLANPYDVLSAIRRVLRQASVPSVFVVDLADLVVPSPDRAGDAEKRLLAVTAKAMIESAQVGDLRNLLVLVTDELGTLPAWVYRERPYINVVKATLPPFEERYVYLKAQYRNFYQADRIPAEELKNHVRVLANLSDGMAATELDGLWRMSRLQKMPLSEPRTLMKRTLFGPRQDPWRQIGARLRDYRETMSERVIGQPTAVERVGRALTAATVGIDFVADAYSAETRPKGIFFFVGPTGVGKTELARGLSKFVFDDEAALARFDMSTFTESHNAERLTGAPPGYVGHERGGELTNRVSQRPFSVLLFDEIEKAHPAVFDKFLQVLDDGRLTDALGNTAYFSETIIIFTSNLGAAKAYEWLGGQTMPDYDTVARHFEEAVREHFTEKLRRPELLGRLGGGVTAFDILRPEHIDAITRKLLGQLTASAARREVQLRIDEPAVVAEVQARMRAPEYLLLGVRGIRNVLDERVRDPLVAHIFDNPGGGPVRLTLDGRRTEVRRG